MTDPRNDLGVQDLGVKDRFLYFIEQLQDHVGENLGSYQQALQRELDWIKYEEQRRQELKKQLP